MGSFSEASDTNNIMGLLVAISLALYAVALAEPGHHGGHKGDGGHKGYGYGGHKGYGYGYGYGKRSAATEADYGRGSAGYGGSSGGDISSSEGYGVYEGYEHGGYGVYDGGYGKRLW